MDYRNSNNNNSSSSNNSNSSNNNNNNKATFVEVFGSIRFSGKASVAPARPWPETGFAVNKSTHIGEAQRDEYKLIRSSN